MVIFKSLGIEPGAYTILGCLALNKERVNMSDAILFIPIRYKKLSRNQCRTAIIVKTVNRHIIDEIKTIERNKLEQVNYLPEETVCNDDVDMTVESLVVDISVSFRKLKDFHVISNEVRDVKPFYKLDIKSFTLPSYKSP